MRLKDEHVKRFFYWINERHNIYLKRQAGEPWPWTSDPILREYKFTNVFRELDTGTVWLRKNIREPYADHPELFFNIAMYRLYNYWPTAEEIGFVETYDPDHYISMMRARHARGEQIFTGAHMLPGVGGMDKIDLIFGKCFTSLWNNRQLLEPKEGETLESSFYRLRGAHGYGPFISYEVVSDLRWTRYLEKAPDIMTWANPGPGAKRGVIRLTGVSPRKIKVRIGDQELIEHMRYLRALADTMKADWVPTLEMREIEHSLCEFDKYERVRLNEGRPRSRYSPPKTVAKQLELF
jgi:hypothetical protein